MLIQGDRILSVDSQLTIPKGAIIHQMDGDYIYPSFIELHSEYGIPTKERLPPWKLQLNIINSKKKGAFKLNEAIHPEVSAHQLFSAR